MLKKVFSSVIKRRVTYVTDVKNKVPNRDPAHESYIFRKPNNDETVSFKGGQKKIEHDTPEEDYHLEVKSNRNPFIQWIGWLFIIGLAGMVMVGFAYPWFDKNIFYPISLYMGWTKADPRKIDKYSNPFIRPIHPINSIPHWTITSHIFRANVEIIENQNEQRKKEFHSYIQEEHKESETLKSMSDESKINQQKKVVSECENMVRHSRTHLHSALDELSTLIEYLKNDDTVNHTQEYLDARKTISSIKDLETGNVE